MKRSVILLILTFVAVSTNAQMPPTQAAYEQQRWNQQQMLYGQLAHDEMMRRQAADNYQQAPKDRQLDLETVGLESRYGAIVVRYRDDILLDNYSCPLPFSWEAFRDQYGSVIEGKRFDEIPVDGIYSPFDLRSASNNAISRPGSLEDAEEKIKEHVKATVSNVW